MLYVLAGLYVLIIVLLMLLENYVVYPAPRFPVGDWDPAYLDFENVFFESADGTQLHGWYVPHAQPRGYLLYCHGNGEHVAYNADLVQLLNERYQLGVFIFDYRGYGRSAGRPNEKGVTADGHAALGWLLQREGITAGDVIVMGRSLGGAVAVDIASQRGAKALVVENTFTRMPDVAATIYWFLPVKLFMRNRFNSLAKIKDFKGPLLLSHGKRDSIVPFELGKRLYDASESVDKQLFVVDNGDHNDRQPREYYQLLDRFFDRILASFDVPKSS